jgi:hypothetical protein
MTTRTKFYPVIQLCKDDLIECFRDDKEIIERIEKLDEYEMQYLADKVGDMLMELGYWETLKEVFEYRFLKE